MLAKVCRAALGLFASRKVVELILGSNMYFVLRVQLETNVFSKSPRTTWQQAYLSLLGLEAVAKHDHTMRLSHRSQPRRPKQAHHLPPCPCSRPSSATTALDTQKSGKTRLVCSTSRADADACVRYAGNSDPSL